MKIIDLHTHTTASDGTYSPEELIDYAIEKELSAIAITDHDTVQGVQDARNYLINHPINQIELISGIEFSTKFEEHSAELHIIGLFVDETNPLFNNNLERIINARSIRNIQMVKKLNEQGINITIEEVNNTATDEVVTRAHFAKLLTQKGYIKSPEEAFQKYIGYTCPCFVKREKLTSYDAINIINTCGGVPILAHPTLYHLNNTELDLLVADLTKHGLKGIEGIYSLYSQEEEDFIHSLAQKYNLAISGGSDFHGSIKKDIDLAIGKGNLQIPYSILTKLRELSNHN